MLYLQITGCVAAYLIVGAMYGCICRTMGWPSLWIEERSKIDNTGSMGALMLLWPGALLLNAVTLVLVVIVMAFVLSFSNFPKGAIWLCDNSKVWVKGWLRRRRKQQ